MTDANRTPQEWAEFIDGGICPHTTDAGWIEYSADCITCLTDAFAEAVEQAASWSVYEGKSMEAGARSMRERYTEIVGDEQRETRIHTEECNRLDTIVERAEALPLLVEPSWYCDRFGCGYMNTGPVCTKCGKVRVEPEEGSK